MDGAANLLVPPGHASPSMVTITVTVARSQHFGALADLVHHQPRGIHVPKQSLVVVITNLNMIPVVCKIDGEDFKRITVTVMVTSRSRSLS